jgi:hypothetical protein
MPFSKCFFHIRGRGEGREKVNIMEFHFSTSLLLKPAGNRQKTMQEKIEDRKAIRKSARRTFLSLTT